MLKSIDNQTNSIFLGGGSSPIYTLLFMFKDHDGPHRYGRCSGPDICGRYWEVSTDSAKLFPSAEMRISCPSWLVYKVWYSSEKVQWTYCRFNELFEVNLQNANQKTFMERLLLWAHDHSINFCSDCKNTALSPCTQMRLNPSLRHPDQHLHMWLSWISECEPVLRRKTFSLFRHVCIAGNDWASIKHANGHLMDVLRHLKAEKCMAYWQKKIKNGFYKYIKLSTSILNVKTTGSVVVSGLIPVCTI